MMHASRPDLDAKLVSLRQFVASCPSPVRGVRLVEFSRAQILEATDVPLQDVEGRVTLFVCKGLLVDWVYRNQLLYLRASERSGPVPSWERVFAEEDLADVKAILRATDAGDGPP